MARKPNKKEVKNIAKQRIKELFEEAEKNKNMANRYVELARKIAMKNRVRIPSELKRRFCKHCYKYLVPGKNLRVRIQNNHIVYSCLECKKFMRFPHKKE
jgi:ribonuclease P protein subunit RPR2